jgi:peptidoglycan hydrolase-like protein with peptidoglycan-binding domain
VSACIELLGQPRRDLGSDELWKRSRERSRLRRMTAADGGPAPRSLVSAALVDLDGPLAWRADLTLSVRDRDLADPEIWDVSLARVRAKRRAAQPGLLPQARVAGASLLVAAVAAALPVQGGAHSRARTSGVAREHAELLRFGSRGPAVAEIQRALGIDADGIFGPRTRAAVRSFQKRHGLVVDGIVGPQTRAALARERSGARNSSLLRKGSRGPAVAALQRALGITADGIFGPRTHAAVRSFQKRHGLVVDGIVGPQTRAALARNRGGSQSGSLLRMGSRGPAVAALQRALGIPADGIFGPQTRSAVRQFQARHGLTVDGIAGPQTLGALKNGRGGGSGSKSGGSGSKSGGSSSKGGGSSASKSRGSSSPKRVRSVDRRLWAELALARRMGLSLWSAYRPGSRFPSGKRSDHSYYPSKAIDVAGSTRSMRRYARAVAGRPGVDIVIHSPVGIWQAGVGWSRIDSPTTRREHYDHVHVDTF